MTALKADSLDRVRALVSAAYERSHSLLYVVSHLVDTARAEVEDMWYRGELGVVEEHQMLRQLEVIVADFAHQLTVRQLPSRQCTITSPDSVRGEICRRLLEEDGWKVTDLEPSETDDLPSVMPGIPPRRRGLAGGEFGRRQDAGRLTGILVFFLPRRDRSLAPYFVGVLGPIRSLHVSR